MTSNDEYVLDASVFIQAARRYYAFDLAPKFWNSLIENAANGRICSIDRVLGELKRGKDDLTRWATDRFDHAFVSTDQADVIQNFGDVMIWVNGHSQFRNEAKADFARGADGWLVAYAMTTNCVVVTEERLNPDIRRRVPIPNVCNEFDVLSLNTFELLRKLGVRFE